MMNTIPISGARVLVAYFSHSGNTRQLARMLQKQAGADLFEITPVEPYPEDYDAVVDQAKRELRRNHRPALTEAGPDLAAYELILVGSPNWWSTVAPPVMSYLEKHDFTGKAVATFITHEGSGLSRSEQDVARLARGARVLPGQAFWGSQLKSADGDAEAWLRQLGVVR